MEFRIYDDQNRFLCSGENSTVAEEILKDSYLEYTTGYKVKWILKYWNPLNPNKTLYEGTVKKEELE
jgi:hypothetical protein